MIQRHFAPTIKFASSCGLVSAVATSPVTFPARKTVTRSVKVITSLSLCVMSRIVLPSSRRLFRLPKKFVGFLRGQHRRGFIQNQDLRVAIQQLEDFNPLLDTHGQFLDGPIPIHRQAVLSGKCFKPRAGFFAVNHSPPPRLGAQQDVVQRGIGAGEHEMLMHHADARRNGARVAKSRHAFLP